MSRATMPADTRKKYLNLLKQSIFRMTLLIVPFSNVSGQQTTQIHIEDADVLKIIDRKGKKVQQLIGNAILRQDSTYFYCDTATLDNENNLHAAGGVHINFSDSVHLYGDYLNYSGNTRIAVLDSNVRLVDRRATLYTDHLEYDRNLSVAYYFTGGRIVDDQNELTSKTGRYYNQLKEFFFKDSVVVTNPDYVMYADTLRYNTSTEVVYIEGPTDIVGKDDHIYSEKGWYDTRNDLAELTLNNRITHQEQLLKGNWIFYDREREYGKAVGNVWLKDTAQNLILEGGIGEFYRAAGKVSYLTDSARAILIESADSLFLHADSLLMVMDSARKAKYLFAYHRMKFFRDDLQGMCDSLVYRIQDSVIAMLKNPVLWSEESQLTADSIWMFLSDNRIDSMMLFNLSLIVSRDSTESYNQIKGKRMTAYFRDNELFKIKVDGNAETIYFVREETRELIGINRSISSGMVIMIEDNQIRKTLYLDLPDATMYPEDDLPKAERLLRDFKWLEEYRPKTRDDIYLWQPGESEN